ncbi:MAG: serine hydrolase domain-containing protein [bacterium]|nr:serine hydrolase domain-containing protein [bacterium]
MKQFPAFEGLIEAALDQGLFPGIEVLFARGDELLLHRAYGRTSGSPKASALEIGRLFDLASLTKPLATALAMMRLVEQGKLYLEQPAYQWLPQWEREETLSITLLDLLTHRSGLPAWAPLFQQPSREAAWQALLKTPLKVAPGAQVIYSCLNFLLLAEVVRRASGVSLSTYCQDQIYRLMGLTDLLFNPGPNHEVLETAHCPWRQRRLVGEVQDQNAARFDGEGGNAGLFGTAADLFALARMLLNKGRFEAGRIFGATTIQRMLANQNQVNLLPRGIGWDVFEPGYGYYSCGDLFSPGSFGHIGYTGTGLWVDPHEGWVIIHLSHRVWYGAEHQLNEMKAFRPLLHNALIGEMR